MALGATGTTTYSSKSTRSGTNTSFNSNRLAAKPTPARSAPFQKYELRTGTYNTGNKRLGSPTSQSLFKAPANMPKRLNNTAAASVAYTRNVQSMVGFAYAGPLGVPVAVGYGVKANRIAKANAKNNVLVNTRLQAQGYRVGGIVQYKIKPVSKAAQARAQKNVKMVEARHKASAAKKQVNLKHKATKVNARSAGKVKPNGGGRRRSFRVRRDGNGRFAGSY
jgi:hypothetical protein